MTRINHFYLSSLQLVVCTTLTSRKIDRPTTLYIHGNSMCMQLFYEIMKEGSKAGIGSISLDLPGCGKSGRLDSYTPDTIWEKIISMMSYFPNPDRHPITIFAYGLGCKILRSIDVTTIDCLAKVVLCNENIGDTQIDIEGHFAPSKYIIDLMGENMVETDTFLYISSMVSFCDPKFRLQLIPTLISCDREIPFTISHVTTSSKSVILSNPIEILEKI